MQQNICPTVTTFLTYISPLIADTQFKTLSTEGIDSSTSRQPQDRDPYNLQKFLAQHILDSSQKGISSVLMRMDGSGFLDDMKKITLEEKIFTLTNFGHKKGHQNTSGPSSEVTKTKLKERLEGKDTAVIFSEDDDNNSFLHKSEGQDERTENTRKIPETCYKDERR